MWFIGKKGASGFSSNATAEQVTKAVDGTGLTAIVTGASSGIGFETTRVLALRGVTVIMAVRNVELGKKVREIILNETPNANVNVMALDLGSQASVRKFVDEFKSSGLPLHILINNAGILAPPFTLSKEKVELTFATNYLGHFLLTNLLLETMKSTSHEHKIEGRIVNVSSEGHRFAQKGIDFDKISEKSGYNPIYAYGLSKMANILHANELARLLKEEGEDITVNSVHPGMISTNMFRNYKIFEVMCNWLLKYFFKTIAQGASTTCYVALNPQVKGISGEYFADNDISKPCYTAKDPELAKKLWEFSLNLTNST